MMDVELLAPAGSFDSLVAAVESGADAVYLGGKKFSARQYAGNFDDDEIKRAVEYCRVRGVKIYVTVNTLLKDRELKQLPEYAAYLYNIGTDAIIVQDIGVGSLIRSILPDFELHASTQMTAHNLESVNFLYNLGYKRVVLSRELSLEEIRYIGSNTDAEIEAFTHGALCICYSGQCLMSSMIGGRSGNRGRCAQPCRQVYTLKNSENGVDSGYLLSPKDLSTIEHMDIILNTPIKSLKIEGRMKKPEYVAAVTTVYRKAIDNYRTTGKSGIGKEEVKDLLKIFNRGGFTTAHLFKKSSVEMMSTERPKNWGLYIGKVSSIDKRDKKLEISLEENLVKGDGIEIWVKSGDNIGYTVESVMVKGKYTNEALAGSRVMVDYRGGGIGDKVYKTYDIELSKRLERTYSSPDLIKKIPVDAKIIIGCDRPAKVVLKDSQGNTSVIEGPVPEEAKKLPLTSEKLKEQIVKLGGTPFSIGNLTVELEENLALPISAINLMRREAVDKLTALRINSMVPESVSYEVVYERAKKIFGEKSKQSKKKYRISVMVNDTFQVKSAITGGADIIILDGSKLRGYSLDYKEAIDSCRKNGVEVYAASPRIIRREYNRIIEELNAALAYGADGIYCENAGIIKYCIDSGIKYAAGFSMNIFNLISSQVFMKSNCDFISLSPELSLSEISQIAPYVENCEAFCYGRIEMMVSEYCPIGSSGQDCKTAHCEKSDFHFTDRMGMEFPVRTDIFCRSHIYNSKTLSILENINELRDSGVNIYRLNVVGEEDQIVVGVVKAFRDTLDCLDKGMPVPENVNSMIEYIKSRGYTKGHYYRGVE